jgi:hypothetical protein
MLRGFLLDIYLNRGYCKDVRHNRIVETHCRDALQCVSTVDMINRLIGF